MNLSTPRARLLWLLALAALAGALVGGGAALLVGPLAAEAAALVAPLLGAARVLTVAVLGLSLLGAVGLGVWWRLQAAAAQAAEEHRRWDLARQELLAQLERSERMASLGRLAAGVGHEINNPLAFLSANLAFVAREAERVGLGEGEVAEALAEAREGADRIRDVVRQLQGFSSRAPGRPGPVDVARELDAALRMAAHEIRHRARLEVEVGPMPAVRAAEHQLGQVFLNLLVNAAQAIPEGHADGHRIRVAAGTDPQGRARIEVKDTGRGIAPELLPRIFEPFFTTRAPGEGTGLGLSICHGAVVAAGGTIEVESLPGAGSTFRVLLPPAAGGAPLSVLPPARAPRPARGRRGRVLVIDDEPHIGHAVSRMLADSHQVHFATSAAEARVWLEAGERYDAVLCDLEMPEVTGMDFYDALAAADPGQAARVVFITGGAFTGRAREFLARTPRPFLEKPLDPTLLREALAAAEALALTPPPRPGPVAGAAAVGATAETLERLPAPALIVDRDIRILAGNRAARALVAGCRPGDGTGHRVGELLGCVHAQGEGCGVRKECLACVIRRSVERALAGEPMERTPASLRILSGAGTRELNLHVAAAALRESGAERALLTL